MAMGIADRDNYREHHRQQTGSTRPQGVHSRRPGGGSGSTPLWKIFLIFLCVAGGPFAIARVFLDQTRALPFPRPGEAQWFKPAEIGPRAGLHLQAPPGSRHFMVRLDDWATGAPVVTVPVRGGEAADVQVPLGRYRMTIAKGTTWLGSGRVFGMLGEVREVTEPLEFYQQGPTIMGHRFQLEVPFRGNVDTVPVRRF
jgi:hypothetical protein